MGLTGGFYQRKGKEDEGILCYAIYYKFESTQVAQLVPFSDLRGQRCILYLFQLKVFCSNSLMSFTDLLFALF